MISPWRDASTVFGDASWRVCFHPNALSVVPLTEYGRRHGIHPRSRSFVPSSRISARLVSRAFHLLGRPSVRGAASLLSPERVKTIPAGNAWSKRDTSKRRGLSESTTGL